ncbi:MAG TPA: pantetheine-phosphate adenylyltransferase [Hypericibacter adhaerens]|jgi:pantetheine-phosphate adenylyltransferase|uniref:Phosphopantetheine adenylyltransferase n=1 Tax=Hypericibacter adhaerens TaxID=2602016 RepID=A0A5J6MXA9_9PROT|nr:pantetheine-phosphate adenylyltransferase [Hypericibacter adhaerens]QEX22159.1 phosphopantetheine adenylyltransferase [Hypericibacter adhaerens]HWA43265.1 pantetheine-phosphate adenylyltransferase [Hypericibacter adhaerens]
MPKTRIAVYPGTFDPITNGHLDIIRRAARLVDRLVIGVSVNAGKGPLLSLDDRVRLVQGELVALDNGMPDYVEVVPFNCLLMDFAMQVGASSIIRGLRAVSDFEYEFQMAGMNARLNPDIETVFLMASDRHQFISSRFVKEIGRFGGDIRHFVSPRVADYLETQLGFGNGKKKRGARVKAAAAGPAKKARKPK